MSIPRAATTLAAVILAATAPQASAGDNDTYEINGNQPVQRGTTVSISVAEAPFYLDLDDDYITLESPAFVKPVKIKRGRFISRAQAAVRCGIEPGTYPVRMAGPVAAEERRRDGPDERTDTTMTVTTDMDDSNRAYCASDRAKKAEAPATAAKDHGTLLLAGAGAALFAAAVASALFLRRKKPQP
ncbi:hypothetical protein OG735_17835 [Streptomyces sp. NBC_01210]|uniref:hypothetical protein n=1 Tax=Streptomyces sp. NBC_01210 TaxID=2903774 RepID=UPI002E0D989B|nr:hypothetical protein OG735_17835 [Streptomyces sp. NBC_01210]